MALIRSFTSIDESYRLTIPSSVAKELKLKPGQLMELKVQGVNGAPYIVIHKRKVVR